MGQGSHIQAPWAPQLHRVAGGAGLAFWGASFPPLGTLLHMKNESGLCCLSAGMGVTHPCLHVGTAAAGSTGRVEHWARAGSRQGMTPCSAASLPAGGGDAWRDRLCIQPQVVSSQ